MARQEKHPNQWIPPPTIHSDGSDKSLVITSGLKSGESEIGFNGSAQNPKPNHVFDDMLKKFHDLNVEGNMEFVPKDEKDVNILCLVHQIKDLERQVKKWKEWAHQKAMHTTRKSCNDIYQLRMGKEENQQFKKITDDPTKKSILEMQRILSKANGLLDCANITVRHLEIENAEIRAETEASKLIASEYASKRLEVSRREKTYLKKILAWEKLRAKLQEDIITEKNKIMELGEEMLQVETSKMIIETKRRREQKAKDVALAQIEVEKRLKEATEANIKRNHEALRLKIEVDLQRHKDDLQMLKQELSCLKSSTDPRSHYGPHPQGQPISTLLHQLDDSDENETWIDRECINCSKNEVSVLLLPCAHQVLCRSCNDEYSKKGIAKCPACQAQIEQKIRVFGAT